MLGSVAADFEQIYDDHVWAVYGFVAYRVRSQADAEDLTQATFERALRAWGRFDAKRATPRTWLLAIASNLLIDHYRRDRSGSQQPLEDSGFDLRGEASGPEDQLGIDPDLAAALDALSGRDRQVVALRFGGDLKGPEIAELLDLSIANVQQILSRALRRLRAQLEPTPNQR